MKVLNRISNPRNDCANCGRSNFCIQARQSVHQAAPGYGRTGSSCGPVKSNIWRGSLCGKKRAGWLRFCSSCPGLGFPSWHTAVWGEGDLGVRPQISFSWKAALPLLVMVVSASLTARAGTLGGCSPWVTGCEPSFIYLGCWHRAQERAGGEEIGSETVTPSRPSEQSLFVFLHGGL